MMPREGGVDEERRARGIPRARKLKTFGLNIYTP